jgi:hypothetical protein
MLIGYQFKDLTFMCIPCTRNETLKFKGGAHVCLPVFDFDLYDMKSAKCAYCNTKLSAIPDILKAKPEVEEEDIKPLIPKKRGRPPKK